MPTREDLYLAGFSSTLLDLCPDWREKSGMGIQPVNASAFQAQAKLTLAGDLPFGKVFTPHILTIEFDRSVGWRAGKVTPRKALSLDPAAMCLHYGQTVFEGLKAHHQESGDVVLFRVMDHARRMQRSCERLCMPPLPVDDFVDAMRALVMTDYAWVPDREGTSLYLRPTMIATEPALGVRPSDTYLFYVLAATTGPYFASGFSGIRVAVERKMTRAAPGGLGSVKSGANYVASMYAAVEARKRGCAQVLWLDAGEHRWVEETGASNVFWVEDGVLCTSPTMDTILAGITRDGLVQVAQTLEIETQEKRIAIDDLVDGIRTGRITELFGSGTAAVVTPISELLIDEQVMQVADGKPGRISRVLLEAITAIHRGKDKDRFGWCTPVPRPSWVD